MIGGVILVGCSSSGGDDEIPVTWTFVDGGTADGINFGSVSSASNPQLTVYGDHLFAIWQEDDGSSICQIRVKKNDGNSWSSADGGAAYGINQGSNRTGSIPQLAVYGSNLYAIWREFNGTTYQIRVKEYNGSLWTFIDGGAAIGINYNYNPPGEKSGDEPQLAVFEDLLYAIWIEPSTSLNGQIRLKAYDSSIPSWSWADGGIDDGINFTAGSAGFYPQLATFGGDFYGIWREGNSQIRVLKKNGGSSWSSVDGGGADGINYETGETGINPQLTEFGSHLYAAWSEFNHSVLQLRVKRYDGSSWSWADGGGVNGINYDVTKKAFSPQLTVFGNNLYAIWEEDGGSHDHQIRVKKYNGSSWSWVDGGGINGINYDNKAFYANSPQLTVYKNKLYATWSEDNGLTGRIRVKRMD